MVEAAQRPIHVRTTWRTRSGEGRVDDKQWNDAKPGRCGSRQRRLIGQAEITTKPHHDTTHTAGSLAYGVAPCPILWLPAPR